MTVEDAINELRRYDRDFLIGILLAFITDFQEHLTVDYQLNAREEYLVKHITDVFYDENINPLDLIK